MRIEGNNVYADEGMWLYQNEGDNRLFYQSVTLAKPDNVRYFAECTDEKKKEWEESHPIEPAE